MTGFEPATPRPPDVYSNRAELHPDNPISQRKVQIEPFIFVPKTGVEPAHLAAPPPEDGASTNFAIWAVDTKIILMQKE